MRTMHLTINLGDEGYREALETIAEGFQDHAQSILGAGEALEAATIAAEDHRRSVENLGATYESSLRRQAEAFRERNFALAELGASHNVGFSLNEGGDLQAVADYHQTVQEGILDTALTVEAGIARSLTVALTGARDAHEALRALGEAIVGQMVQLLVRLAAQALVFGAIQRKTQASASGASLAAASTATFGSAFASVMAALPFPLNVAAAPGVAAAATAAMQGGAVAASAAGNAAGGAAPAFHSGGVVDGGATQDVPAVLQGGEMVLTRAQQAQLFELATRQAGQPAQASSVHLHLSMPNYLGDRREFAEAMAEMLRSGPVRAELRRAAEEPARSLRRR